MDASCSLAPNPHRTSWINSICSWCETVNGIVLSSRAGRHTNPDDTRCRFRDRGSAVKSLLEQRCCSSGPTGLALVLRNLFHVVHVCTGLRQDVMQIVSNADEAKSLLEELADSARSEQEDAEDDVVLFRGGFESFRRIVEFG